MNCTQLANRKDPESNPPCSYDKTTLLQKKQIWGRSNYCTAPFHQRKLINFTTINWGKLCLKSRTQGLLLAETRMLKTLWYKLAPILILSCKAD